MSLSNHLENALLDHVFGTAVFAQPSVFIALRTADPGDDGAGLAEPVGAGYARVLHSAWQPAAMRSTTNSSTVTFAQADESWGLISHFALFDAVSGGNLLAHGPLNTARQVSTGDAPQFATNQINVRFTAGGFSDYLAHKLLDHVLSVQTFSPPTIHMALSTASPGDDGASLNEPAAIDYARVGFTAWAAAAGGAAENQDAVTFAEAAEPWGTASHFAILDAAEAGNLLVHGPLAVARTVLAGDTPRFLPGELHVTLD